MAYHRLDLTVNQRAAVASDNHTCLISCPGSGKTRTIVAKLLACLDEVRGTARRVGCITYTNAAVYEIESRVREFISADDEDGYQVSTIHSFCLRHIVRPYGHLVPDLQPGFVILVPEDEAFREIADAVTADHDLSISDLDLYNAIQRVPRGGVSSPDAIGEAAAEDFLARVSARGYRTFSDSVYYAWKLATEFPFIGRSLASGFAWFLVDEFQDTSVAQVEILSRIADFGRSRFFLVGDPNQSIMGFAGARPDLMLAFSSQLRARTDTPLVGNFRSSRRVIAWAEKLLPNQPPMEAVGPNKDYDFEPMYINAPSLESAVIDHFLPAVLDHGIELGKTAILAPTWYILYPLGKKLRREGIPIFGPGARPYKRRLVFAPFAEEVCAYLESKPAASMRGVQRALFHMVEDLTGRSEWRLFSYEGRILLATFLHAAQALKGDDCTAESWLRGAVDIFEGIAVPAGILDSANFEVVRDSTEKMIQGLASDAELVSPVGIEHIGLFAVPRDSVSLMTLHHAKGREFDAVALVDLHDGRIPHWKAGEDEVEEARRVLYVGITRARKLLMLFTDNGNRKNRPSRLLGSGGLDLV